MKQYIKAEFALFKKNTFNVIAGCCGLFIYAMLLLFSGIGSTGYVTVISLMGYMAFLFFIMALYFSPASYWKERQKVCVSTEQMVLNLGESKRVFVQIRILAFFSLYVCMLILIAFMQFPAFLIAGEGYSVLDFGIEVVVLTVFVFLTVPVLYLVPARWLMIALPGLTGFSGGIAGGIMGGSMATIDADGIFTTFLVTAGITVAVGLLSVAYRWWKTIRDERCR